MKGYQLLERGVRDLESGEAIRRGQPGWERYEAWLAEGNVPAAADPPAEVPLDSRRREARAQVNGLRHEALVRLEVTVDGRRFAADPASASRLALAIAGQPASLAWRDADNEIAQLDRAGQVRLAAAIAAATGEVFEQSWDLKDRVIARAAAPEALDLRDLMKRGRGP